MSNGISVIPMPPAINSPLFAPATSPRIFNIPAGPSFVDSLASGLTERSGGDPLALAAMLILLPTRRACRSLREAFLRLGGGKPMLLPRMLPLGDLDEDELVLVGEGTGETTLTLPPAISGVRRQLLLARLIQQRPSPDGRPPTPDQAARLAAELGDLLDSVQTERLSFERLAGLVPEIYADHWQQTLQFLTILTEFWPAILDDRGAMDSAARRNRVLEAQARQWRQAPPSFPIIAAGSTGSIPAAADLMAVVAGLPQGCLILPGLDCGPDSRLDEASWQQLDQAHPQFGLKQLLGRLGLEREDVRPWSEDSSSASPRQARMSLLSEAMRPAATTESWRNLPDFGLESLEGVSRVDCPGPREEAGIIALMMRQVLERDSETCALVTPDRDLARRVAGELRRWGIVIDDSAGRSLSLTPAGGFLRLTAALVAEDFAPYPLLSALKHPLAAGGESEGRFRAWVRNLERIALRGPRPGNGLRGLRDALPEGAEAALADRLEALASLVEPFRLLMSQERVPLADLVRAHMEFAEALAASDKLPGPARLWKGEEGVAVATFAAELGEAAVELGEIDPARYPALLDSLMAGRVARPSWGGHPRLSIWGPLEARLQQADLLILGGLNEGVWPGDTGADPWMSRPMREAFGLPAPERRIGLSAHDFAQAFGAPRIVLTRSAKQDGVQTVPSRWLLRLQTVLEGCGLLALPEVKAAWSGGDWLAWHHLLDHPKQVRAVAAPEPRPPVTARPRRLSVTAVETWMRDPYGIYARYILGLEALDPIDADPGAADYGTLIHGALERFLKEHSGALGAGALEQLLAIGREEFAAARATPGLWAFWWPRFESIAAWVVTRERARRGEIRHLHAEVKGRLEIDGPAGPFTLTAKADRIDEMSDGSLVLIDYKTGAPPTAKEVKAGFAPQLPLEAAIAAHGGFAGVAGAPVSGLLYWRLKGGAEGGQERLAATDASPTELAGEALAGLERLVELYDRQDTPYRARPHPEHAPRYSDYLHLARVKEWATLEDSDDGGGED